MSTSTSRRRCSACSSTAPPGPPAPATARSRSLCPEHRVWSASRCSRSGSSGTPACRPAARARRGPKSASSDRFSCTGCSRAADESGRMDPGGDKQERPAAPDASQIADAMATAIKACAVWPRRNPRVQQSGAALAELLRERIEYPGELEVRVRGSELLVGRDRASPSLVVGWLIARFRDVGLAGLELAAGVDRDALIDFGAALARAGRRSSACTLDWPARHPTLRPL